MRTRLLSLALVVTFALLGAVSATAATLPGSSYQWQQPGCAPVHSCCTQPQLSFAPTQLLGLRLAASSSYRWTQPGTAPVYTPDAQPW